MFFFLRKTALVLGYWIQLDGGSSTPVFGARNGVQTVPPHRWTTSLTECLDLLFLFLDVAQLFATAVVKIL